MNASILMSAVLLVGTLSLLAAVAFRTVRVVPSTFEMEQALSRMNTTTLVASLAGLLFALWAWVTLPTAMASTTRVPGLLAALGPATADLVYLGVVAVGEATWRGPTGPARAANLARRPRYSRAQRWASRALAAWATLLALCVVMFGAIAEPDGRSLAARSADGCVVDAVPVPCDSTVVGPFPGWAYGGPIALGAAALLAATLGALYLIARRPAVPGASSAEDEILRTVSATRVVRGSQLAIGTTVAGVLLFAGAAAGNAGWWWSWTAVALAVGVLGTSMAASARRVAP